MTGFTHRVSARIARACLPALVLVGCASVPQEAPVLSMELGKRLSAIEAAHIALLHKYFDERRERVDEFVFREWTPTFTEEAFRTPSVQELWNQVVASDDAQDRIRFVTLLGPRIQTRINGKLRELHAPLDDLERAMEQRLRDEYAQAKAINNGITSFLASAAEVDEARDRYLEMFGVTDQKAAGVLDRVDAIVGDLLQVRAKGETALEKAARFRAEIDKLREAVSTIAIR